MSTSAGFRDRLVKMTDQQLDTLQRDSDLSPEERELVHAEQRSRDDEAEPGTYAPAVGVVLRDVDVPFWNLMAFMVKGVIASIPALIILVTVMILVGGLLIGFLREFR